MNVYDVHLNFVELQDLDPNADLAHYFDVIAGTSTGGLITVMLATPSPHDPTRAAFTPAQIVDFYQQEGPHIFNESWYHKSRINILRTSSILTINCN